MTYFVVDISSLVIIQKEGTATDFLQEKNSFYHYPFETKEGAKEFLKHTVLRLLPQINSILNDVEPTVSIKMDVRLPLNINQVVVRNFIGEALETLSDRLGTEVSFKINFV